jgi:hypothetical protein
MGNMFLRGA